MRKSSDSDKMPFIAGFGYALAGIAETLRTQRNMRIHLAAALCVTAAGFVFRISTAEWCVCLLLFALVMGLELVNTALEAAVDLTTREKRPLAKKAKDAAAGAVLVGAFFAALIGGIIFLPKLAALLQRGAR